jgi:hypothetical protein
VSLAVAGTFYLVILPKMTWFVSALMKSAGAKSVSREDAVKTKVEARILVDRAPSPKSSACSETAPRLMARAPERLLRQVEKDAELDADIAVHPIDIVFRVVNHVGKSMGIADVGVHIDELLHLVGGAHSDIAGYVES